MNVPPEPDETFEALVFDWDGTAVSDRQADAVTVRNRIEALCAAGVHVFVVSGTHVGNIDGQLQARPSGRGRLHLCCNRGSEVFEVTASGPALVHRRRATAEENRALDRAAEQTATRLQARGLEARVVAGRLNRRKIDLIPVPEWADPKKADIAQLAEAVTARLGEVGLASLAEVVGLASEAAQAAGLVDPRITSDVKHVEIGLTDKSDSADFAAAWLADRGIAGQLVLIGGDELGSIGAVPGSDSLMLVEAFARAAVVSVGVEPGGVPDRVVHLGGGPERFMVLLDAQLGRRADHRVPQVDVDPNWVIPLPVTGAQEHLVEALGALANGWAGARGSREENGPGASPLFVVAGVYGDDGDLLAGPVWTGLEVSRTHHPRDEHRLVDLHTGTLARFTDGGSGLRSLRFISAASPTTMALRAESSTNHLEPGDSVRPPRQEVAFERTAANGTCVARTSQGDAEIAVAAHDFVTARSGRRVVERLAAWSSGTRGGAVGDQAGRQLAQVKAVGFDALLAEHRSAWARLWADAEVVIEGTDDAGADQLGARLSVFHLLAAAAAAGEAAVGARGLTGEAYAGHVFWDADVFVLPALAAIRPEAARAMLEYRIRRLPAARAEASAHGLAGARFPWESAGDGSDVTPRQVRGRHGELIPIATGAHEVHIVGDVA